MFMRLTELWGEEKEGGEREEEETEEEANK